MKVVFFKTQDGKGDEMHFVNVGKGAIKDAREYFSTVRGDGVEG